MLNSTEHKHLIKLLKRQPSALEKKIAAALWNEHCSYKSTRTWVKKLYNKNDLVLHAFGENAGAINIGDGKAILLKIESHNHPSFIDPYNGAATGVGGILRDIFVMGGKPIALMNSLRFGTIKKDYYCTKVSDGIAAYGNSFGVATIGGEVEFDSAYDDNILVNVLATGIVDINKLITTTVAINNFSVYYMGALTDIDGLGGAIFASSNLTNKAEPPIMQIADPFLGRCCYEAFQELLTHNAILASTDLGASGLCCAITELAIKNNTGIELYLDEVPTKQPLTTEQILFSETQERILVILKPRMEKLAQKICSKWNIAFAKIAQTTASKTVRFVDKKSIKSELPLKLQNPLEIHNYNIIKAKPPIRPELSDKNIKDTLINILKHPNITTKAWFYNQFDSFVQGNSVIGPGEDCAIIKLPNMSKYLAFKIDAKPPYCLVDSYKGTLASIIRCWRSLNSIKAQPLAITNNLNFGNPNDPLIMGQLISTFKALNKGAKYFNLPIISGNISLNNTTKNKSIPPTPVIAAIGSLNKLNQNNIAIGDHVYIIGKYPNKLRTSILHKLYDDLKAYPPSYTLKDELRYGKFVRNLDMIKSVKAMCSGGLLTLLAKTLIKINLGVTLTIPKSNLFIKSFSEENISYVVFVAPDKAHELNYLCKNNNILLQYIGYINKNEFKLEKIFNIDINTLIHSFTLGIYHDFESYRTGNPYFDCYPKCANKYP